MTQKALKLVQQLKHLAGKHPQKSHAGGRGKGGGKGKGSGKGSGKSITGRKLSTAEAKKLDSIINEVANDFMQNAWAAGDEDIINAGDMIAEVRDYANSEIGNLNMDWHNTQGEDAGLRAYEAARAMYQELSEMDDDE